MFCWFVWCPVGVVCVVSGGGALCGVVLCWYVALSFFVMWCCAVVCRFGSYCPTVCCFVGYPGGALVVTGVAVGLVCLVAALFFIFAARTIVLPDNG